MKEAEIPYIWAGGFFNEVTGEKCQKANRTAGYPLPTASGGTCRGASSKARAKETDRNLN